MTHFHVGHLIVSAIVKGVIYATIWHAMRGLPLAADIAIAVAVIAVVYLLAGRRNSGGGWRF